MPTTPSSAGDTKGVWLSLQLAWEMGYLIALPVLALGFGGAYLDRYVGTSPLCTLSGFVLAAVISSIAIYRRIIVILQP